MNLSLLIFLIFIDDVTLYILINGIGVDFHEIATTIRVRDTSLTFEELHALLISHENYFKLIDASNSRLTATVNAAQHSYSFKSTRPTTSSAGYSRSSQRRYVPREKSTQ